MTPDEEKIVLAAALIVHRKDGHSTSVNLSDVPEAMGSFAVYDGFEFRGGGCARNMRSSASGMGWSSDTMRVYQWRLDHDGSVYNWFENGVDKPLPSEAL